MGLKIEFPILRPGLVNQSQEQHTVYKVMVLYFAYSKQNPNAKEKKQGYGL
jgi:hypothetical protein